MPGSRSQLSSRRMLARRAIPAMTGLAGANPGCPCNGKPFPANQSLASGSWPVCCRLDGADHRPDVPPGAYLSGGHLAGAHPVGLGLAARLAGPASSLVLAWVVGGWIVCAVDRVRFGLDLAVTPRGFAAARDL